MFLLVRDAIDERCYWCQTEKGRGTFTPEMHCPVTFGVANSVLGLFRDGRGMQTHCKRLVALWPGANGTYSHTASQASWAFPRTFGSTAEISTDKMVSVVAHNTGHRASHIGRGWETNLHSTAGTQNITSGGREKGGNGVKLLNDRCPLRRWRSLPGQLTTPSSNVPCRNRVAALCIVNVLQLGHPPTPFRRQNLKTGAAGAFFFLFGRLPVVQPQPSLQQSSNPLPRAA